MDLELEIQNLQTHRVSLGTKRMNYLKRIEVTIACKSFRSQIHKKNNYLITFVSDKKVIK